MAVQLEARGIKFDVEPMIANASGRSVGRPDLARAMVAAGHVTSMKEAFSRHLFDGGPVDIPHHALPLPEALELGRAAGAAMSLAHPHLYDHLGVALLRRSCAPMKLTGVEGVLRRLRARRAPRWIELAAELDLPCTGGSDWHGPKDAVAQVGIDPRCRAWQRAPARVAVETNRRRSARDEPRARARCHRHRGGSRRAVARREAAGLARLAPGLAGELRARVPARIGAADCAQSRRASRSSSARRASIGPRSSTESRA